MKKHYILLTLETVDHVSHGDLRHYLEEAVYKPSDRVVVASVRVQFLSSTALPRISVR